MTEGGSESALRTVTQPTPAPIPTSYPDQNTRMTWTSAGAAMIASVPHRSALQRAEPTEPAHQEASGHTWRFPNFPGSNLLKKTVNPQIRPRKKVLPNAIPQGSAPTTDQHLPSLTTPTGDSPIHSSKPPIHCPEKKTPLTTRTAHAVVRRELNITAELRMRLNMAEHPEHSSVEPALAALPGRTGPAAETGVNHPTHKHG